VQRIPLSRSGIAQSVDDHPEAHNHRAGSPVSARQSIEIDEALVLLERKMMQRDLGMRCEPLAAPAMVYNG
jgi:hypothetical protein